MTVRAVIVLYLEIARLDLLTKLRVVNREFFDAQWLRRVNPPNVEQSNPRCDKKPLLLLFGVIVSQAWKDEDEAGRNKLRGGLQTQHRSRVLTMSKIIFIYDGS